jgi:hypothetical protein
MLETRGLFSKGIGFIDAQLIASCVTSHGTQIWTIDRPLGRVAESRPSRNSVRFSTPAQDALGLLPSVLLFPPIPPLYANILVDVTLEHCRAPLNRNYRGARTDAKKGGLR